MHRQEMLQRMEKQSGTQLLHGKMKSVGAGMKSAQEEHHLTGGNNKVRAGKTSFRSRG
jgi:hypothetical protein